MTNAVSRVLELLTYIEQVEKLKSKPAFTVPTEYFVAYQHELKDLPELQFNLQVDDGDVWLRIPRLKEVPAPSPSEELKPWITVSKSPDKKPVLKASLSPPAIDGIKAMFEDSIKDRPEIQVLFDEYVANHWTPWSKSETPRRKTIARYNHLFTLQPSLSSDGMESPLELVWGMGFAAWKHPDSKMPVQHPLIVQTCEIVLNEDTFDIEVRPRQAESRIELDPYRELEVPGVRHLDTLWKSVLANQTSGPNPFMSSTFESVLKAAVGHLDPSGTYEERTDDVMPPPPGETLKITNTWVLFARKRSADVFLDDIRRLKANVEVAPSLPGVVCSFVEEGDSSLRARPEQAFRGLSNSDGQSGAFELYFPMPYNDEQVSIIQKLENNDGVVVQGPPGTGKTHTIANVISHYLANGKRVLVTAKGESALAVLQEKLPPRIRPLSVALLSDERDGMKQFEHSVEIIASSVAALNPARAEQAIAQGTVQLDQLHAKIANVDRNISAYADKHMRTYSFQGKDVSPEEMAKLVMLSSEDHAWFDDTPPASTNGSLQFDDAEISALRQARIRVGEDLPYLSSSLPAADAFPAWSDLVGVHRDLVKARSIESSVSAGGVLALLDARPETLEKAQELQSLVAKRMALRAKLVAAGEPWIDPLGPRLAELAPDDTVGAALRQVCADVAALENTRRTLLAKAVHVPELAEIDEEFTDALTRLIAGKSAFALPFGKGAARKLVAAVTVLGLTPATNEDWRLVQQMVDWRVEARKALVRWTAVANEFDIEPAGTNLEPAFKRVVQLRGYVEEVVQLVFELDTPIPEKVQEVFGTDVTNKLLSIGEDYFGTIALSLQAHADKSRLVYAVRRVQELQRKLEGRSGGIVSELESFLSESIGRSSSDEGVLQTTWQALIAELYRLLSLRPSFDDIARVSQKLVAAGAPAWAERVRTIPAAEGDPVVPPTWLEAWNWRQAVMFLERIDGHATLRNLFEERRTLTASLARTYQDLIAEKTWLGVYNNSPDNVRQALQSYLTAVQSMGAGTGVRAIRHRQTARTAMQRAYQAVPCWVLPHWRVSETLPSEIGLFDLVVIDEASQSDIWALPALLRGKKLLIVGDHKQVSPSAVGTAEEKIKELSSRFLANQPHGAQMTPDQSIYDLARVVFAGNSIMLKEHFRCVPAIIEFSNREFYEGEIRPLRLPKANERLDPPLIDVYVKGGFRKGDANPAEALAIVNEIESILKDEKLNGRSIGVVTLLGTEQAAHIHELISRRISPAEVLARRITVGPPPVFQGRERDIMLVSMVLGPTDRAALNKADMRQRFNVALSRARDRMYLFRSVEESTFKEDTLNARLIRHFRQPFRQDAKKNDALRDQCESGFELEMFDELVKRGYRVQPQVACGGYFIDFVVEGDEGRRLAIECDGDRYHGPGQWSADMARQRVLERAGWTFWRCFASSFVRRREEVVNDLLQTLERQGIQPLGADSVDNTVWVTSREVDPFEVEGSLL
jgi:very-short-patch-repair endonuclease